MNGNRSSLAIASLAFLASLMLTSCVTIPEATKEEKELQDVKFASFQEILNAIHTGTLKPYQLKVTREKGLDLDEHFSIGKMMTDRLLFRSADLGEENEGYLREENPLLSFPVPDDPVESDTFQTFINVWRFDGEKGKKVDIILRSYSTFPTGMFLPYVLLIDSTGSPLARQEKIVCLPKEATKSESFIVWLENCQLPMSQPYYVLALADMKNAGASRHLIRLGRNRYSAKEVYMNLWGTKYEEEHLPYLGGSSVGVYDLVVKMY